MPQPFVVGLIVNPVAGLGGPCAHKGSDAPDIRELARAAGVEPQSALRTRRALRQLVDRLAHQGRDVVVLTGPGELGEDAAAGLCSVRLASPWAEPDGAQSASHGATTAASTRTLALALRDSGVDLLLFAGGDGTARDILDAVDGALPVLGIPAGVKIYSAAFALTPVAAGSAAAAWLLSPARATTERDVVDIDEDALRAGAASPAYYGSLRVPVDPTRLQDRKTPTPASDATAVGALADAFAASMRAGHAYVLGPGGTTLAVGCSLGLKLTRLGVDVVRDGVLLAKDATAAELEELLSGVTATIVVTPLGGQGFIVGRGNQQLTAELVRGTELLVIATPAKLASLGTRALRVDTGSAEADAALSGYTKVFTGPGTETVYPVGTLD
ncbi:ATP-NAD kinase family protein [Arthrobacter sp. 35W]|uniref:ATP-NAD kinase family protein n=1 Tax=Arthrobacter sp. 35W TaxID=1132441 RepID=UPI000418BAA5|nr:ATP-NAD kinase family protein [Arthrobacter sp. 35W]